MPPRRSKQHFDRHFKPLAGDVDHSVRPAAPSGEQSLHRPLQVVRAFRNRHHVSLLCPHPRLDDPFGAFRRSLFIPRQGRRVSDQSSTVSVIDRGLGERRWISSWAVKDRMATISRYPCSNIRSAFPPPARYRCPISPGSPGVEARRRTRAGRRAPPQQRRHYSRRLSRTTTSMNSRVFVHDIAPPPD